MFFVIAACSLFDSSNTSLPERTILDRRILESAKDRFRVTPLSSLLAQSSMFLDIPHVKTLDELSERSVNGTADLGILVEIDCSNRTLAYSIRGELKFLSTVKQAHSEGYSRTRLTL
jgi:hypothetical protein